MRPMCHPSGTRTEASLRDCPMHPAVVPLVARMLAASKDDYLVPSTADNQYANRYGVQLLLRRTSAAVVPIRQRLLGVPDDISRGPLGHTCPLRRWSSKGHCDALTRRCYLVRFFIIDIKRLLGFGPWRGLAGKCGPTVFGNSPCISKVALRSQSPTFGINAAMFLRS